MAKYLKYLLGFLCLFLAASALLINQGKSEVQSVLLSSENIPNLEEKEEEVGFSTGTNDLVHRSYEEDTIEIPDDGLYTLVLHNISSFAGGEELEGIYIYNIGRQEESKLSSGVESIRHEIRTQGSYIIYGITKNGDRINFSRQVSVEYWQEEEYQDGIKKL